MAPRPRSSRPLVPRAVRSSSTGMRRSSARERRRSSGGRACPRRWTSCAQLSVPSCPAVRSSSMGLELVTAGESHGPALVAIVTGLPAGLTLEKAAIDADLHRRQQGYGRSPRQQIEHLDLVLRHGRTLGTPLALV